MDKQQMLMYLLKLQGQVDVEGLMLFGMFLKRATESGDPKEFIKGVMKAVVDAPETSTSTQTVMVKVLPKKAGG